MNNSQIQLLGDRVTIQNELKKNKKQKTFFLSAREDTPPY